MSKTNIVIDNYLHEIGFDGFPKGWTKKSIKKYAKTLGGETEIDTKEWFYKCVDKLKDETGVDDPEKLCASIKDEVLGKTKWRGEEREEE